MDSEDRESYVGEDGKRLDAMDNLIIILAILVSVLGLALVLGLGGHL